MARALLPPLRTLVFPLLLATLSLLVALSGGDGQRLLRFERHDLGQGELWRLLSAHFVHLGWSHLWLNLAGLALIWLLVGAAFSRSRWTVVFLVAAVGTSGGLWFFQPRLDWYVGLSGVLHGLLVAGALASWRRYRDAPLLLGLVAAKIAWEQWVGPIPGSEEAAGGPVVVSAHLYGAVSGAVAFVLLAVEARLRGARAG